MRTWEARCAQLRVSDADDHVSFNVGSASQVQRLHWVGRGPGTLPPEAARANTFLFMKGAGLVPLIGTDLNLDGIQSAPPKSLISWKFESESGWTTWDETINKIQA